MSKVMSQEELYIANICNELFKEVRSELAKQRDAKNKEKILTLARLEMGAYELIVKNSIHSESKDTDIKQIKASPSTIKDIMSRDFKSRKATADGVGVLTSLKQEEELVAKFVDSCYKKTKGKSQEEIKNYVTENIAKIIKVQRKLDEAIKKTNGGILAVEKQAKL